MSKGEIVLTDIQETQWSEEAVIDSPFEAKDFIKVLPWKAYSEEVDEYGSLRAKLRERNDEWTDSMEAAADAAEAYGDFDAEFATHNGWDSNVNKWTIDADSFNEARKFWEFCGFKVSIDPNVDREALE